MTYSNIYFHSNSHLKRTDSEHTPFLEKSTIHAGLSRNNYSELQMNSQSCLTVEEAILKKIRE